VNELLTTRQLQDLLQVDRITIYRMLHDGRLRGFKVGGQWRFSRREIEAWLLHQQTSPEGDAIPPYPEEALALSSQALPLSCIQGIQDICAEALDIAAITTNLDGTPLTGISNSCDFCDLILSTDEGRRRCAAAWSQAGKGQVHPCHAGLLCVSVPVEVNGEWVAIADACQFAVQLPAGGTQAWQANLPTLAAELGLAEQGLCLAASSVRVVAKGSLPRISRLLQRVADTFCEIGQERLRLLSRLQHIAKISKI
jgi:excisionase family DNA binding protein